MWTVKCAHDAAKIQKVFGNKKKKREKQGDFLYLSPLEKILSLEKTQKSFGFLLAYSYLCKIK